MAIAKTILYLLFAISVTVATIFAFVYFGFLNYFWPMIGSMFIGIIGTIMSGILMATLLFPKAIPIMLANQGKETNNLLHQALGKRKSNVFGVTQIICVLTFGAIALYTSFTVLENRNTKELNTYGKTIKVGITDTHYANGRNIDFSFVHNNNLYHHSLGSNTVQIGDSIYITYSTRLPHLVRWAN